MDPLSIIASTISIADIGFRVASFLYQVKKGTDSIDEDLRKLADEINALKAVTGLIRESFEKDIADKQSASSKDEKATAGLWYETDVALKECQKTLKELEGLVIHVVGDGKSSTTDKLRKYFQKLFKESTFLEYWQKLSKSHQILQILLTAINITYTRKTQATSTQSFSEIQDSIKALGKKLELQIASLEDRSDLPSYSEIETTVTVTNTKSVLATAETVRKLASTNVHYMVPQSVSSNYTGRQASLEVLKRSFVESEKVKGTKVFVVYGLGGSGKTQFCCKFAQDNRNDFWGVFYIDASTPMSAQASLADIAKEAGIEPNERSVRYWLSSQKQPWLLLVDNVEDRKTSSPPETYLPDGESGLVLLITRNHSLKTRGNLGPRSIEFKGLEEEESTNLLLRSAGKTTPFASSAVTSARTIGKALGFLPLALVQAGSAILEGKCTLDTCLAFFERSWARIRETVRKGLQSDPDGDTSASNEVVYSTYEMVVPAASEDAVHLLKLMSFMHRNGFKFRILIESIMGPSLEAEAQKQAEQDGKADSSSHRSPPKTWGESTKELIVSLVQAIMRLTETTTLPKILHDLYGKDRGDVEFRLRDALSELRSLALIDHVEADDSYSIHPLVHWWVRESMSLAEQALWCQAACTMLAQAVLLPPLGQREADAELRRYMLPHIDHVRQQEVRIKKKHEQNRRGRKSVWPVIGSSLRSTDVRRYAKFGLVYAENGEWKTASELLSVVDDFLSQNLGLANIIAIKARLFLSELYMLLGKEEKAATLQRELLEVCEKARGEQDVETLLIMDRYGVNLWQQAKFDKALEYAQKAADGLEKARPPNHLDFCKALTHLGRVVGKLPKFDEAVKLHTRALAGLLRDKSRPAHDREILEIKENLAMARYDRHRFGRPQEHELQKAEELQLDVFNQREKHLGKEHPLTLWACCNLARIKAGLGALVEAEQMVRIRIPIAERNLGETHIGTLFGKMFLGHILMLSGKLDEAQELLELVVDEHERNRRGHADQLVAEAFLLECYSRQRKYDQAEPLRVKVVEGTRQIFGEGSPWETYFTSHYSEEEQRKNFC